MMTLIGFVCVIVQERLWRCSWAAVSFIDLINISVIVHHKKAVRGFYLFIYFACFLFFLYGKKGGKSLNPELETVHGDIHNIDLIVLNKSVKYRV